DPPLGAALDGAPSVSLEQALTCDVVTVHVPLTARGPHPTQDLIDRYALARMAPDALLINAARGGVVNEAALLERLEHEPDFRAALDCWEGEPNIAAALLPRSWLATPHIAGHTLEARVRAATDLHAALSAWSGLRPDWPALLEANTAGTLACEPAGVAGIIEAGYDLGAHTARMQDLAGLPAPARGAAFDALRRRYGLRRQFASYRVASSGLDADTVRELQALEFDLDGGAPTIDKGIEPGAQSSPASRL
ncbi:MAG: NAD(P)-dependent oxidoreductase, partial [Gammaproteobacteria bacterium]